MEKLNICIITAIVLIIISSLIIFSLPSLPTGEIPYTWDMANHAHLSGNFNNYEMQNLSTPYAFREGITSEDYLKVINSKIYNEHIDEIYSQFEKVGCSPRMSLLTILGTVRGLNYKNHDNEIWNIPRIITSHEADFDERALLAGGLLNRCGFDVGFAYFSPEEIGNAAHSHILLVVNTTNEGNVFIDFSNSLLIGKDNYYHYQIPEYQLRERLWFGNEYEIVWWSQSSNIHYELVMVDEKEHSYSFITTENVRRMINYSYITEETRNKLKNML